MIIKKFEFTEEREERISEFFEPVKKKVFDLFYMFPSEKKDVLVTMGTPDFIHAAKRENQKELRSLKAVIYRNTNKIPPNVYNDYALVSPRSPLYLRFNKENPRISLQNGVFLRRRDNGKWELFCDYSGENELRDKFHALKYKLRLVEHYDKAMARARFGLSEFYFNLVNEFIDTGKISNF